MMAGVRHCGGAWAGHIMMAPARIHGQCNPAPAMLRKDRPDVDQCEGDCSPMMTHGWVHMRDDDRPTIRTAVEFG